MAEVAWVVGGLVVGGLLAGGVIVLVAMARRMTELSVLVQELEREVRAPVAADALTSEMIGRLLDAALPKQEARQERADEPRPGSPAEYEPPVEEVSDWTDPMFGLERELVGGLRPGQGIPGIGQTAEPPMPELAGDPMDALIEDWSDDGLGDPTAATRAAEELFDQWERGR